MFRYFSIYLLAFRCILPLDQSQHKEEHYIHKISRCSCHRCFLYILHCRRSQSPLRILKKTELKTHNLCGISQWPKLNLCSCLSELSTKSPYYCNLNIVNEELMIYDRAKTSIKFIWKKKLKYPEKRAARKHRNFSKILCVVARMEVTFFNAACEFKLLKNEPVGVKKAMQRKAYMLIWLYEI